MKDETGAVVNPTGWQLNSPAFPSDGIAQTPDLSLLGQFSLFGSVGRSASSR